MVVLAGKGKAFVHWVFRGLCSQRTCGVEDNHSASHESWRHSENLLLYWLWFSTVLWKMRWTNTNVELSFSVDSERMDILMYNHPKLLCLLSLPLGDSWVLLSSGGHTPGQSGDFRHTVDDRHGRLYSLSRSAVPNGTIWRTTMPRPSALQIIFNKVIIYDFFSPVRPDGRLICSPTFNRKVTSGLPWTVHHWAESGNNRIPWWHIPMRMFCPDEQFENFVPWTPPLAHNSTRIRLPVPLPCAR